MLDVKCVLINLLINREPSFTNIGGPTRIGNNINTFHVLGVNRVFNRSKGAADAVEGSEARGNIMYPKDSRNLISVSLNEREIHP